MPSEKFGLFGSLGYNLVGIGFNGGINYKFSPDKKVCPTLGAMYGYNGVIKIEDSNGGKSGGVYYGPSFCVGIELKNRGENGNFWNFEIVLPIRSKEFSDDIDQLKK